MPRSELVAPVVQRWGKLWVVREDLVQGGTKARAVPALLGKAPEYVYASPRQGYAQVALAYVCRTYGKRATIFCAQSKRRHPLTLEAAAAGAKIIEVPCGYLSVVSKRARDYCAETGACLLPFGLHDPRVHEALKQAALLVQAGLEETPSEIWSVASSGTLTLALQGAWPGVPFHAVRVGAVRDAGRARIWQAPERYEQNAKLPPPFPSCPNYDAKAWRFLQEHARPGALFWNVAG